MTFLSEQTPLISKKGSMSQVQWRDADQISLDGGVSTWRVRVSNGSGWNTLASSTRDTKLMCLVRFERSVAAGGSTLILALFLSQMGIADARIGLFMTMTLLGDVALSFVLTIFADTLGRKRVLRFGAFGMLVGGVMFVFSANFWVLVLASILGLIGPSAGKVGPFLAIEESILSQLNLPDLRNDVFTWINLLGFCGIALGEISCGWLVNALQDPADPASTLKAYRVIYWIYTALAVINLALLFMLSEACEVGTSNHDREYVQARVSDDEMTLDTYRLVGQPNSDWQHPKSLKSPSSIMRIRDMVPTFSRHSIIISCKLGLIWGIDSFASALVASSWLTYYFKRRFSITTGVLGTLSFTVSLLAACSSLLSIPLARRIGLINTVVFTHLPSDLFLALIPASSKLAPSIIVLLLRSCTGSMDRAPKQAFLAAAILPGERTAIIGTINIAKSLMQAAGAPLTGYLAGKDRFWVVFDVAGAMKAACDLATLWTFSGFESRTRAL